MVADPSEARRAMRVVIVGGVAGGMSAPASSNAPAPVVLLSPELEPAATGLEETAAPRVQPSGYLLPELPDDVNPADALEQSRPVADQDEDDV